MSLLRHKEKHVLIIPLWFPKVIQLLFLKNYSMGFIEYLVEHQKIAG